MPISPVEAAIFALSTWFSRDFRLGEGYNSQLVPHSLSYVYWNGEGMDWRSSAVEEVLYYVSDNFIAEDTVIDNGGAHDIVKT
jgi:hypothetical protein